MPASDSTFKVSIEGPGLAFEQEVTEETAKSVASFVLTGQTPQRAERTSAPPPRPGRVHTPAEPSGDGATLFSDPESNSPSGAAAPPLEHPDLSIRQFIDRHLPKRGCDRVVTIGTYLSRYRDQKVFSQDDVVKQLQDAAESIPAKPARDMKWAVVNGWIAHTPDVKGGFYVTSDGFKAVESKFPKELIDKTPKSKLASRRRRSNGKSESDGSTE